MRNENGASLFLETLLDEGITHLFGNPGTTELPLMDALVNEERLKLHPHAARGRGSLGGGRIRPEYG